MNEFSKFFHFCKRNEERLIKHFQDNYLPHDKPFKDWQENDMARFTLYCDEEFKRLEKFK